MLCWTSTEPLETTPAGEEEPLISGARVQKLMADYRSAQPAVEKTLDDAMDQVIGVLGRKVGESHWNAEEAEANIRGHLFGTRSYKRGDLIRSLWSGCNDNAP